MSNLRPTLAHLRKDSPFAPIFPDGCPIQGPIESKGRFDGEVGGFYRGDFKGWTHEQQIAIAKAIEARTGDEAVLVYAGLLEAGWVPLRASHVESVSFDGRLL